MYLIDTTVISELRKGARTNIGVQKFFNNADSEQTPLFLSAITIGELRRGVDLIRYRGDTKQAEQLEAWLRAITSEFQDRILTIDADTAALWGRLSVPHPEHALDKLIAATAIIHNLTVVTRNENDFSGTGAALINPFR